MSKYIDDGIQGGGPVSAINVTSLVDVMFCLLIMFMVATPLMKPQDKVEVELPLARSSDIAEEEFEFTVISVDVKGRVFLGSTPLSPDTAQMVKEISSNQKLKDDGMAFIQGDQNVPYERIVDVLVALQKAEVAKVGFLTDPKKTKAK
jgi:biopolymer transport protein ExbD